MKWTRLSRGTKALAVSLAFGLGVSACSRDYTVAYLYVTTAKVNPGLINAYSVDYQLGTLVPLADSPIPSGGKNPVGLAVSTNPSYLTNGNQYVYVINHDDSNVVEYSIGTDGKLYQQNTYNVVGNAGDTIVGSLPTSLAMDAQDKFLYVTFMYQNGYSLAKTGPGGVAVFPIATDGSLGTALINTTVGTTAANPLPYFPVGNNPVGIAVTSATATKAPYVYVIDQDAINGTATGVILAFQQNSTTGALTPVTGTVLGGFQAGSVPSAVAADPTSPFLYVTDQGTNQVFGEAVNTSTGALQPVSGSPIVGAATGVLPMGLTVDPRGLYLYVANNSSSTVSSFSINTATGAISAIGGQTQTQTGPMCVTIEPALGTYLYTANNLNGSVSGMQLNPKTGVLTLIEGTPFAASALPTCAAAVASSTHTALAQ
jgi:6-phosphogluconolactonase (cycloisomerase 2 family)